MTRWNPRTYGTRADPVHQSDMARLMGAYGCPRKFAFYKAHEAEHGRYRSVLAAGNRELGTAVHETIARALRKHGDRILAGELPPRRLFERVLRDAFDEACDGREVRWAKGKRELDELADGVTMAMGALETLAERASQLVFVEAPFRVPIGDPADPKTIWVEGTVDLVFEDHSGALHLCDWKTGAQRPNRTVLDRGHQLGLYAYALAHGEFFPDGEACELGVYPGEMSIVHLRDLVPYKRKTRKRPTTLEEAEFFGGEVGQLVTIEAGERRGPAWYASRRRADDHGDLVHSLRSVVGTVRFGRTWKAIGDACERCPFAQECASEGFGPVADERRHLDTVLKDLDVDLEEVA